MGVFVDKTGMRFGRLKVVSRAPTSADRAHWLCRCDCGTEKVINGHNLSATPGSGKTTSCGCFRAEATRSARRSHAMSGTRTHRIWKNIKTRCTNKNVVSYADYGGRGITFDPRWDSFATFLADMGEAPANGSIDRIDNDKGYSPANCRWATRLEQARNKQNTRLIPTAQGIFKTHEFLQRHGWTTGKLEHELYSGKLIALPRRGGVSL